MNNKVSNLIILPGNGSINKDWAEKARDFFSPNFASVSIQYYDHWSSGGEVINMNIELEKLEKTFYNLKGNIVIFAKSAGALLFMSVIYLKLVDDSRISKSIFVGFPPTWARANGFDVDLWSSGYSIPTVIIQNINDPLSPVGDIRKEQANGKFTSLRLIEQEGTDHVYENFVDFEKYLIG